MKRTIFLVLAFLIILPLASYAASIGGAETQGKGKFSVGMDQEFVFDRDMKLKSGYYWVLDSHETIEDKTEIDKMYRTMAKLSYGLLDNLDVYVRLGTADFESKSKLTDMNSDGTYTASSIKMKGDNAFAYGFGMKGKYSFENDWIVGCDVQYLRHSHDLKGTESWADYDATGNQTDSGLDTITGKGTFQEWHIAPYIAKKLGNFLPYLGMRYSDSRANYKKVKYEGDEEESKIKFKADDNFGVFLGTDYKIGENWKINLEGRFVDETAMSFGATYKF